MPDLDRTWVDQFTMQMTIQQADAEDISRALADVRSYCADSGQPPYEAFGDPKAYATTLAAELPPLPPEPRINSRRIGMLLPLVLGLALVQIPAFAPRGDDAPVTLGQVLLVTAAVPAWVVLTAPWARRRPRDPLTPRRPAFDEKGWRGLWVTLCLAAVGAALWIGLDHSLFTVPKWILFSLALALLATGIVLGRVLTSPAPDRRATAPSP